jgi:hypothetical protein
MRRQRRRVVEAAAAFAIHPDEIRIAEATDGGGAIRLASAPEIAAGEPTEDGDAASVKSFPLEGPEGFLDEIGHD